MPLMAGTTGGARRAWLRGALAIGAAGLGIGAGVAASSPARADQPAALCPLLCPTPTTPTPTTPTGPVSTPTETTTTVALVNSPVIPGAAYVGRPRNFSHIITVQVSDNGDHVSQFTLQFDHGRCSDGTPYASYWPGKGAWAITDAAATLRAGGRGFTYDRRGRKRFGHESVTIRLHFASNRLTGTASDHFSGRGYECASGTLTFSAARVGSSAAPLKTPWARTAVYSYHNSSGSIEMDVFLPLHMISWLRAKWTFRCPNEKPLHQTSWVYDIPLAANKYSTWVGFTKTQQQKYFQTVDGHRFHFQQYADAGGFLTTTERGAYEGQDVAFSGGIGFVGAAAPLCSGLTRGTARPGR
jgi:hypothetical protein